jgi:hypothetical protein
MRSACGGASSIVIGSGVPGTIGPPRGGLVAHHVDRLRRRPDEHEPRLGHRPREVRSLGQEPVPRVDGGSPGPLGGLEDRADRQVRVDGQRRADAVRGVGHLDVERIPVGVGVDGHRLVTELADRPDDADGDLSAVRDEYLRSRHSGGSGSR